MKKFLLGILVGVVFTGLVIFILVLAAVRLGQHRPEVADNSILVVHMEGEVPETPPLEIPILQQRTTLTVANYWGLFRKAARDPRIRAVVLMPQDLGIGWGKMQEFRDQILALRKAGKPVYAYLRAPGPREYLVASAAEKVFMAPEDLLNVKGLRAELMYLRGTLDKLGVQVEVQHVGKYKDAGDTLTRKDMSPETREVMNSVLDGLYGQMVEAISQSRRQDPAKVRAAIDQGPFVAQQAKELGLVDDLIYQDQMYAELKKRFRVDESRRVSQSDYARAEPAGGVPSNPKRIAFVAAEGTILRGDSNSKAGQGEITGSAFVRLLRQVEGDSGVKGAIVRIDSPGGDGFASDEIWREMGLLAKKKPLVISMSDTAASGGYYMAMTGDPVLAYPGTLTGSIGVLYGKANLHGLYDKLGITKDVLSRGRFADIDSDYTPLSPAGREKLQESLERFYSTFVNRVAQARKMQYAQADELAQGRVWLGSQARSRGLIDDLGGIEQAVQRVKQRAGIPAGESVALTYYPPRRTWLDEFMSRSNESLLDSQLPPAWRRLGIRNWLRGGIMRVMPYSIDVR